ncbi:hypothetical protein [Azospirillum sp. sgz301742]
MLKIVNLGRTGLYVVMRGGMLATLGGRSYWPDAAQARDAARRENAPVSDGILHTLP